MFSQHLIYIRIWFCLPNVPNESEQFLSRCNTRNLSVFSHSQMAGAKIVSSLRLFWRTITQPSRMPSMRAGMWLSPGKGGPSKPPERGRIRERSISSRGCTQDYLPSPTRTKVNHLSSSDFRPHVERSGTGNHLALPRHSKSDGLMTVVTWEETDAILFLYIFWQVKNALDAIILL